MPHTIQPELEEFILKVRNRFGQNLKRIIVYGSYARGDYNDSSDIDLMILVALPEDEIRKTENAIYDEAFELELKYGKVLSPLIKNEDFFEYWSDTLPFYRNVKTEGMRIA
jgi:predicted nucleotidyltransferase